jgi:hypothetical protein
MEKTNRHQRYSFFQESYRWFGIALAFAGTRSGSRRVCLLSAAIRNPILRITHPCRQQALANSVGMLLPISVDDENVGQWSEEVKITVTGTI